MMFQAFKGKYTLCESGLHVLETQLRQLEAFKDNLDIKVEEDEWRARQAASKRARPPDENAKDANSSRGGRAAQGHGERRPPGGPRDGRLPRPALTAAGAAAADGDHGGAWSRTPRSSSPIVASEPAARDQPPPAAAPGLPAARSRAERERSPRREAEPADRAESGVHEAASGGAGSSNQQWGWLAHNLTAC